MEKESLEKQVGSGKVSQVEDRVLKTAAQFFGEDLLPYVGVKGQIDRVAPTEHVHLELRRLEEDFNFIMKDGSWRHLPGNGHPPELRAGCGGTRNKD